MNQIDNTRYRVIGTWVMIGVAMLLFQVILGGITRLTGSGLSITEWNIVTGTLPPLNENDWLKEFAKYKETPQYQLLNYDFSLSDFKFIFFWEWFHRLWARLIALAFVFPFIYFLWKKMFTREMIRPLVFLFLFGALQGAIGWIMVKSGLSGDAIYVKPTRLALHFVFALALISYAFWIGLKWIVPQHQSYNPSLRKMSVAIIVLIFVQLIFGALLAGHKGAVAAPTWPDINGQLLPAYMFSNRPWSINLIENIITIQFIHRMTAYLLFIVILVWTFKSFKASATSPLFRATRTLPAILVTLQALLGILAVLTSPQIVPARWGTFEWMAQFHQVIGMLLLLSMVLMLFLVKQPRQQP